jgi:hypothetical protein
MLFEFFSLFFIIILLLYWGDTLWHLQKCLEYT